MAGEKIKWTDQQEVAISHRGSNVFVTASAGTGKTAVLSGRCCDILSGADGCSVMNMLVLTFTDAAAEQMRSRIADQIRKRINSCGNDRERGRLRSELILLQGSDISTIHSFCKRLITDHFYKLGIDPGFRLMDEDEQKLLKNEMLEKTIDWAWGQDNIKTALSELLSRRNIISSDGFLSNVIKISDFLDGLVSRENWCERAVLLTQAAGAGLSDGSKKDMLRARVGDLIGRFEHIKKLYLSDVAGGDWAAKIDEVYVNDLERAAGCIEGGDFEECSQILFGILDKKTLRIASGLSDIIKGSIQKLKSEATGELKAIAGLGVLDGRYDEVLGGQVSLQVKVMVELVKRFDLFYTEAKRSVNCLDFADLEHYGLKLLVKDVNDEELEPTDVALMLRKKYKHIFVDEYQDINGVQQAILEMVSSGDNMFVVGDAKQSIYAFRGSEPTIFLDNLKVASLGENSDKRVDLTVNFRSVKGILDFVNKVFGRIMTRDISQIDYDESAMLKKLVCEDDSSVSGCAVEIDLLDRQGRDKLQDDEDGELAEDAGVLRDRDFVSELQKQAVMIAKRIKQMVGKIGGGEFEIYDEKLKKNRAVRYGDIAILMRSPSSCAIEYVEILKLAGIDVNSSGAGGYFETTEISDCISLLKVLDNPRRDIELAAVLRSPFFGVTDEELALVRRYSKDNSKKKLDFYESVLLYINKSGDDLGGRLRGVFAKMDDWRVAAVRKGLAEMIWDVYRESGYLAFVSALPKGPSRRANLLKLHDKAIQFEGFVSSGVVCSLGRFVEFLEKVNDAAQDWRPAENQVASDDTVKILSVHKSKGLEFPVVFLAEMNHQFNTMDQRQDCLYDGELGLGLSITDKESKGKYSSLGREIIESKKKALMLAEEMRVFYVALTRAKEKLILCGSAEKKHFKQIVANGFLFEGGVVPSWQLSRCNNILDWMLYGLSREKKLHEVFATGFAGEAVDSGLFDLNFYGLAETEGFEDYINELKSGKRELGEQQGGSGESDLFDKVKASLGWSYDHEQVSMVAAKCSVTELSHNDEDAYDFSYITKRPMVEDSKGEYSLEVGSATHFLISKVGLDGVGVEMEDVERVKAGLVEQGSLSGELADKINLGSIVGFFKDELGKLVFGAGNKVFREWPFSLAVSARKWQEGSIGLADSDELEDIIVTQGIIDMVIKTDEGLVIVDFKTDRVDEEQVEQRGQLYQKQLEFYCLAAETIMGAKVCSKWLYFLECGCGYELK